jgi:hypothetical protein
MSRSCNANYYQGIFLFLVRCTNGLFSFVLEELWHIYCLANLHSFIFVTAHICVVNLSTNSTLFIFCEMQVEVHVMVKGEDEKEGQKEEDEERMIVICVVFVGCVMTNDKFVGLMLLLFDHGAFIVLAQCDLLCDFI